MKVYWRRACDPVAATSSTKSVLVLKKDVAVDVRSLQKGIFSADSELESRLKQLQKTMEKCNGGGGVGVGVMVGQKRTLDASNNGSADGGGNNSNNKRAALALKARLKVSQSGESTNNNKNNTNHIQQQEEPPHQTIAQPPPPPPRGPPPATTLPFSNLPPPPRGPPPATTLPFSNLFTSENEPELIFLGTGSAEPSQHRGASAIYLGPAGRKQPGFLLDCGEGCCGQLVRVFGQSGAAAVIRNLAGVWVSHRHADHMSGVLQL